MSTTENTMTTHCAVLRCLAPAVWRYTFTDANNPGQNHQRDYCGEHAGQNVAAHSRPGRRVTLDALPVGVATDPRVETGCITSSGSAGSPDPDGHPGWCDAARCRVEDAGTPDEARVHSVRLDPLVEVVRWTPVGGASLSPVAVLSLPEDDLTAKDAREVAAALSTAAALIDGSAYAEAVASQVAEALSVRGVTVAEASEQSGIPRSTLERRLGGDSPLSLYELKALADVCGTTAASLARCQPLS